MISITIPFRDKVDLLRQCVFSVLEKTIYDDYEIILVNNQSKEDKTKAFLGEIEDNSRIRILNYDKVFNFSAINNFVAKETRGEFILFLNNDTEVISPNWLGEMLNCLESEQVGAVGAELFYPDNTIQHAGVMLERERLAIHAFRKWKENDIGPDNPREWMAVTAACMLTKKELFLKIGGFDEINLAIAYNDIDYCLKIRKLGYKIICVPNAKLYHHESASRKSDIFAKFFNRKRYKQFIAEQDYMREKWSKEIANDPFYNKKNI